MGGLALTVNFKEVIFIGDDISVEIFRSPGKKLQVYILAPKSFPIHRVKKSEKDYPAASYHPPRKKELK